MKYLLFVGSICLALILTSGAWANPDLFIYYSYDSFGAVVLDESGNGHDGAVVGDVTPDGAGSAAARRSSPLVATLIWMVRTSLIPISRRTL